jgi:DNA-binding Xre family transcriptional regulator
MIVWRLRDILQERRMSRRELARRSGVNINTVCKWAHGPMALIDVAILDRVCAALQVQPGALIGWSPRDNAQDPRRQPKQI